MRSRMARRAEKERYGPVPDIFLITLIVLGLLFAFFRYTPLGLAMRAAAQNPQMARLVGVRVDWMLALGWGLASAIGSMTLFRSFFASVGRGGCARR